MTNNLMHLIAKHVKDVHFGGNWSTSNLKDQLLEVDYQMANHKYEGFNSIGSLVYHINYYVYEVSNVLEGGLLLASDKLSFDVPVFKNEMEWQEFLSKVWNDANRMTKAIELLNDDCLLNDFTDAKYGNYFRNLHGIIEHTHYHLGQIVVLKKMMQMM